MRRWRYSLQSVLACLALFLFAAASGSDEQPQMTDALAQLPINQLQVLGTHNSYAQPIDPALMELVAPMAQELFTRLASRQVQRSEAERALMAEEHPHQVDFADARAYAHPSLRQQLDAGLRSLEIDVYNDPDGGRFLYPVGYERLRAAGVTDLLPHDVTGLSEPGLKVLHVPDIDFRSHCPTFVSCLETMAAWSEDNPDHVPVFVLVELKTRGLPLFDDGTEVLGFERAAFEELDRSIFEVIGRQRVITPAEVRGPYPSLNAAVRAGNWPRLQQVRGRFLFLLITAGDLDATEAYLELSPQLEDRAAFPRGRPGDEHAAFLMLDNAIVRDQEIRQRVREGYLVRTRADIETWEARANDYARAAAALRSGAQIVSTDFYRPGNSFGTGYHVRLPGSRTARRSPAFDGK